MDNIRKKMQSLKYETDELYKNINDNEQMTKEANDKSDRCDCDIRDFSKKITTGYYFFICYTRKLKTSHVPAKSYGNETAILN